MLFVLTGVLLTGSVVVWGVVERVAVVAFVVAPEVVTGTVEVLLTAMESTRSVTRKVEVLLTAIESTRSVTRKARPQRVLLTEH